MQQTIYPKIYILICLYMFYGVTMIFLQNIKLTLPEFSVKENFSLKCRKKEKNPKKEQSIPEIFRKSYYQNILNRIRLKRYTIPKTKKMAQTIRAKNCKRNKDF